MSEAVGADLPRECAPYPHRGLDLQPETRWRGPVVEVVVPVYNEQDDLARSVRRLHGYLNRTFPYSFRVTIADNAARAQPGTRCRAWWCSGSVWA